MSGDHNEVKPELHSELRSGVGPIRSTNDAIEGNEMVEGRGRPKFMPQEMVAVETQGSTQMPPHRLRLSMAARKSAKMRFTWLLHHVNEAAPLRAFLRQKRNASAGIDETTVAMYEGPTLETEKSYVNLQSANSKFSRKYSASTAGKNITFDRLLARR